MLTSAVRRPLAVLTTAPTSPAPVSAPVLRASLCLTGIICPCSPPALPTAMFSTRSDGKTCEDIDECSLDNGLCQQICINKVGVGGGLGWACLVCHSRGGQWSAAAGRASGSSRTAGPAWMWTSVKWRTSVATETASTWRAPTPAPVTRDTLANTSVRTSMSVR